MASPISYKDPYWNELITKAEAAHDVPSGFLQRIVSQGERSNADQVSEKGAKTVFQIIPETRDAVLKKYGIDAYLSDENAARSAALLLKESLDRNRGDQREAAGEYIGGTNRKNWGPVTAAYQDRVMKGANYKAPTQEAPSQGGSTFDRVKAQMDQSSPTLDPKSLTNIVKAYKSGQMDAEAAKQLEEDVASGAIVLPRGEQLKESAPKPTGGAQQLPPGVLEAYQSGKMDDEAKRQLEEDAANGFIEIPPGFQLGTTKTSSDLGFIDGLKESVTGSLRETEESKTLPEWTGMPELNQLSLASAKTGLGTIFAGPEEVTKVIKSNFPDAQVRKDPKGNYIIKSSVDGKDYVIPPGLTMGDIPRVLAGVAAFTPAGRATSIAGSAAASAGTQAAIEASQAATGGNFDPAQVGIAGILGGVVPPVMQGVKAVANAAAAPVKNLLNRVTGAAPEAAAIEKQAAQAVAPTPPAAPVAAPAGMDLKDVAQASIKAGEGGMGSKKAAGILTEQAMPNPKTVEAAKRLGIEDYLQADHVTTNQVFREVAQAVKSMAGSKTRAAEIEGLTKVAGKADDLITTLGGTDDLASVSSNVKKRLMQVQEELSAQETVLFNNVRANIPATTPAAAGNVLKFIDQRATDLGGAKNLSSLEKMVKAKLGGEEKPTYALLDMVRKDVGSAGKISSQFKTSDSALKDKLYGLLAEDQKLVAQAHGMGDVFEQANKATQLRKGIENDVSALFGKALNDSIVGDISGAIKLLPSGNTSKFINLIKSVPEDMRQEVVASGLNTAFGKIHKLNFNDYAQWYGGLLKNKQAHAAIMTNLPPQARKSLSDLYRVSEGIAKASKERITTGRLTAAQNAFEGGETLAAKIYDAANRQGLAVAAGTVGSAIHPSLGVVIASALSKGAKTPAIEAADKLFASSQFQQTVKAAAAGNKEATKAAAKKLAKSSVFSNFVFKLNNPKELSNRERWILQSLEASGGNVPRSDKQQVNSR